MDEWFFKPVFPQPNNDAVASNSQDPRSWARVKPIVLPEYAQEHVLDNVFCIRTLTNINLA